MVKKPLFANKYRNGSFRCQNWNYTSDGWYMITVCTKYRSPDFGYVKNGRMVLNDMGRIVQGRWLEIAKLSPCVQLDEFIIMPDHIHGIIHIRHANNCRCVARLRTYNKHEPRYEYEGDHPRMSGIAPRAGSISTIVRSFKSATAKHIHPHNPEFQWQKRFHDRIIQSPGELQQKRTYIRNNPKNYEIV